MIIFPLVFNIYLHPHAWSHGTHFYLFMDSQPESIPDSLDRALQAMSGWLKVEPTEIDTRSPVTVLWAQWDLGSALNHI